MSRLVIRHLTDMKGSVQEQIVTKSTGGLYIVQSRLSSFLNR